MKLLLDAHISRPMLEYLRAQGHDCVHAAFLPPALPDRDLLDLAVRERRIIVTADKDFGDLVFRWRLPAAGVVLLRLSFATEAERTARFIALWPHVARSLPGYFVTVTNRRIRRTPLPSP